MIIWDPSKTSQVVIMLNPSTADEFENDPTVERCERRARSMGYGGLTVLNIFALRSTDPKGLYESDDPIGPLNDRVIELLTEGAWSVICGWGTHGKFMARGQQVCSHLRSAGVVTMALKLNKDGSPGHPLYVPYHLEPVRMP
jgi:hypothetical protein